MTYDLEWLKQHALFSCSGGCAEEVSHHAADLRLLPDGDLICDGCFDNEPPIFASGKAEWTEGNDEAEPLSWCDLPQFDPFAFIEATHEWKP